MNALHLVIVGTVKGPKLVLVGNHHAMTNCEVGLLPGVDEPKLAPGFPAILADSVLGLLTDCIFGPFVMTEGCE